MIIIAISIFLLAFAIILTGGSIGKSIYEVAKAIKLLQEAIAKNKIADK